MKPLHMQTASKAERADMDRGRVVSGGRFLGRKASIVEQVVCRIIATHLVCSAPAIAHDLEAGSTGNLWGGPGSLWASLDPKHDRSRDDDRGDNRDDRHPSHHRDNDHGHDSDHGHGNDHDHDHGHDNGHHDHGHGGGHDHGNGHDHDGGHGHDHDGDHGHDHDGDHGSCHQPPPTTGAIVWNTS